MKDCAVISMHGRSFEVYRNGDVYRLPFVDRRGVRHGRKQLSVCTNKQGYLCVYLGVDGVRKGMLLHRMLAVAFIENNRGATQVNHIDGNKGNCSLENLEWVTPSENAKHAFSLGLLKIENHHGERCRAAKLTAAQVVEIRRMLSAGMTHESIARTFGVTKGTIGHIKRGSTWAAETDAAISESAA